MTVQGTRFQGPKPAGVTDEHLLLLVVQVADVPIERAHVRVELAAQLARILEPQMDPLLVTPQMALVRGAVAAVVARILHPEVHPFAVLLHRLPTQEVGAAQVADLPTVRVLAGLVQSQLLAVGRFEVA